jgi:hypothetical protein
MTFQHQLLISLLCKELLVSINVNLQYLNILEGLDQCSLKCGTRTTVGM